MAASKVARWLAPLAIVAVVAAVYVVVHKTLDKTHTTTVQQRPPVAAHQTTVHHGTPSNRPSVYIVKSGDNLSSIAARSHVSLSTLEALNPKVNPSALQTGQHLRLR